MLPFLVAHRQFAIFRSGSADDNADDFANQQRAASSRGPMSSMESDTEADTDNILSHGGDLNALSNNRRRRRHKQASSGGHESGLAKRYKSHHNPETLSV